MNAVPQPSVAPTEASRATLGFIPDWWDGESLYGWCARTHALRGGRSRSTGHLLFGREHASRVTDFLPGIGRLVEATRGQLGTAEEILRQRTVLASYWPFASKTTRRMVLDAATDVSGIPIPMALGLPASKLGADHPLRYCQACHREALASEGYSTWLLRHQLPGVWWCHRHEVPLAQVLKRRAIWHKPGADAVRLGPPLDAAERNALLIVQQLAMAIAALEQVNEDWLAATAVHRLRQIGIATSAARLNNVKMNEWLESSPLIRWMRRQGDLVHVLGGGWAIHLLRGRRRGHPLKWQILWACAWQADTVEAAVRAFVEASQSQQPLTKSEQAALWPDDGRQPLQLPLPASVSEAFNKHETMREVAEELGGTVGAVRQWMVDYPDLGNSWLIRIKEERMRRAVQRIEECMCQTPGITRTQLLNASNSEFNWLGRNAPAAARALLSRVPTDAGPQRSLF